MAVAKHCENCTASVRGLKSTLSEFRREFWRVLSALRVDVGMVGAHMDSWEETAAPPGSARNSAQFVKPWDPDPRRRFTLENLRQDSENQRIRTPRVPVLENLCELRAADEAHVQATEIRPKLPSARELQQQEGGMNPSDLWGMLDWDRRTQSSMKQATLKEFERHRRLREESMELQRELDEIISEEEDRSREAAEAAARAERARAKATEQARKGWSRVRGALINSKSPRDVSVSRLARYFAEGAVGEAGSSGPPMPRLQLGASSATSVVRSSPWPGVQRISTRV